MPELLAAAFGLLIGSFLNVCIHRLPRDLSVVRPRSRCTICEKQIAWYDNVPLVSYAILRGRCRACRTPIPWRYPAVELLTAAAFLWFTHLLGPTVAAVKYCVLSAILIALAFADLETRILPDELTLGGALAGIVFAVWAPLPPPHLFDFAATALGFEPSPVASRVGESLTGAFFCSGLLWTVGWLFEKIRHKEGLGLGDVKMLVMIGAFLGLYGSLLTIIVASVVGAVVGFGWIFLSGRDWRTYQLPFGSFLALAAMIVAMRP